MTEPEQRDADFSWLAAAIPGFRATVDEYDLEWPCTLAAPARGEACDRAELQLGLRLPPSLRAFYLAHDGAEIAHYRIRSLSELVAQTLRSRVDDLAVYEEPVDDLLDAIDLGDGNRYVLDTSKPSAEGEYPVLDAFHEYGPSDWRAGPIAASFGAWLRGVFESVAQRRDPFGDQLLEKSTLSARYLIDSAAALVAEGRQSGARIRLLRAVAFADYSTYSQHDSLLEPAVERLRQLGGENEGDAFLLRLFERVVDARRIASERGEYFGMSIYCADRVYPPEHFAERNGLPPPPELAGIMRAYGSITLFGRHRYPAPFSDIDASLTLYGGAYSYLRRVGPEVHDCAPDSQVIGTIGSGVHWAGYPHDLLLWERSGQVSRVPFRPAGDGPHVRSGGTMPFEIRQASAPIPVAASIEEFVEAAFQRYKAGQVPYDL